MKNNIILILAVSMLCSFTTSEKVKTFTIVGKWENIGKEDKDTGFIFDDEGYAYMFKKSEKIGGKDFSVGGVKGVMKYVFDVKSNPHKLDLLVTIKKEKTETKKMLMLVKVIDNNTIEMAAGTNEGIRPTKFTKDNSITFKRLSIK